MIVRIFRIAPSYCFLLLLSFHQSYLSSFLPLSLCLVVADARAQQVLTRQRWTVPGTVSCQSKEVFGWHLLVCLVGMWLTDVVLSLSAVFSFPSLSTEESLIGVSKPLPKQLWEAKKVRARSLHVSGGAGVVWWRSRPYRSREARCKACSLRLNTAKWWKTQAVFQMSCRCQ